MGTLNSRIEDLLTASFDSAVDESIIKYDVNDIYSYENNKFPVDILEFAESSEFLGLKGALYAEIRNLLCDVEAADVKEANLILGKGSGKSFISQCFSCYGIYKALELRNPQATFGLTFNTQIYSINVSISRDQAKDVVFKGIKALIDASPYFKDKVLSSYKEEISFTKDLYMLCGHSNSTAFLGYATLRAVMDEVNFMVDNNNRSVAQQLYSALSGSLKTRFPNDYNILCISSDSTPNSFLRETVNSVKESIKNKNSNSN